LNAKTKARNTWPLLVRISHWLVAAIIGVNLVNDTGHSHRLLGYIACVIVFIRIIYGLFFTQYRSAEMTWPRLAAIKTHIRSIQSGHIEAYNGHNPLGLIAIYLMWSLIATLALTGWLSRTDMFWGEDWPVQTHEILADMLLGLIAMHLIAVLIMSKLQKKNLIKNMIKG
jgi:cytochrome b